MRLVPPPPMKPSRLPIGLYLVAVVSPFCPRLLADTVAHWNFNRFASGDAIASVGGSGSDGFNFEQPKAALRPVANTAELPPAANAVNRAVAVAEFTDTDRSNHHYLVAPAVPPSLNFRAGAAFTIEAWVYLRSLPEAKSVRSIISTRSNKPGNPGWSLMINPAGRVFFALDGGGDDAAFRNTQTRDGAVAPGQWYHIAAVRTASGETSIHIDGKVAGRSKVAASYAIESDVPAMMGSSPHAGRAKWDGFIAEVRVSDEALPVSKFLYTAGASSRRRAQ